MIGQWRIKFNRKTCACKKLGFRGLGNIKKILSKFVITKFGKAKKSATFAPAMKAGFLVIIERHTE
jgi:hypothetical protein